MHFTISTRLGKSADICRKRYAASFRRYNECFRREMAKHEEMQRCAIDAMRVHRWALRTNHLKYSFLIEGNLNKPTDNRTFAITTLWLPLHSKREINSTLETLEKVCYIWDKSQNWNSWKVYLFRFSPPRKDDACRRFSSRESPGTRTAKATSKIQILIQAQIQIPSLTHPRHINIIITISCHG